MTHRYFLSLALPLIFATITVPLLGAVDTAVVGQLPDPAYIGGVAVGTVIFNSIYWLFGFLRVSTSGFASQALGADDEMQSSMAFLRPVCIGLIIGLVILLFQEVIFNLSISFLGVQGNVKAISSVYFHIRIWAAPFALMNYAVLGWLLGMEQIKATVLIQVLMNILNIVLAVVLVLVFHLGVAGVAIAVLCAEVFAFVFGIILLVRSGKLKVSMSTKELFRNLYDKEPLKRMMIVNRDLFIRTICLLAVFNTFTAKGAVYGEEVLAANAILIQIHYIMAYFYDGLANAASILTGKAVGQRNGQLYEATVKKSYFWSFTFSAAISLAFFLCKDAAIPLFTVVEEVVLITKQYEGWLILFPLASSIGLVFYGIFAGAAEAGLVRNSMLVSVAVFLAILFPATHYWGNHGLWLSFIVFSLFRSILLVRYMPALEKRLPFMNKQTSA
ncbi:MATE family efflux transporter [Niallia taxi]|uniref:MATE family efflux transporter n=1 Tax=Niallia taxi TaxID=2499688 RepID=UPI002E1A5E69|nr:MATE family efflux transporter [Niallia taxi]